MCSLVHLQNMKKSIYNTCISVTPSSILLYNALTDKFIITNKEVFEGLGIETNNSSDSSLHLMLKEHGFIVEEDYDEVTDAVNLGKSFCDNKNGFHLIINPTLNCNFRCWYCYENHSHKAIMSHQTVSSVINFINRITNDNKVENLTISFFGGEPLLYYKDTVEPVIDALRLQKRTKPYLNISILFTSNGFLINDHIISHLLLDDEYKCFQITLDGNQEQHDQIRYSASGKGSYDRIVRNIHKLLALGIPVGLRLNYTKTNISSFKDVLDDFKDLNNEEMDLLKIDFQRVWQEKNLEQDDVELENTIEVFRNRFKNISSHYNHICNFRSPCYADLKNECVINYNGNVFRCTARDFDESKCLGQLLENGSIEWKEKDLYKKWIDTKFGNKKCLMCRIFPLCGGGCFQATKEKAKNDCLKGLSENEKDQLVLKRAYKAIINKKI